MNAGLCNLTTLRSHLLTGKLSGVRDFDETMRALGLGVAAMFERRCGRRFGYLAGDTITLTGDRSHIVLPRYPIVEVTKVETSGGKADAWAESTDQPISINHYAGLIKFGADLGNEDTQVRVTWTGGFWWETLEPDEDGYPTSSPELDAAQLPSDLLWAFLLHCRAVWQTMDKTGLDLLRTGSSSQFVTGSIGTLDVSPAVQQTLTDFRRYQLS